MGEQIREANQRYNVVNGHHLVPTKRGRYGVEVTEWKCRGCGNTYKSRNISGCEDPTLWVKLGAPGDGVGRCRNCGSVFVFAYPVSPVNEYPCPDCGSIEWHRSAENGLDPDAIPRKIRLGDGRNRRELSTGSSPEGADR